MAFGNSCSSPEGIIVGYLGPHGTYSEEVALSLYARDKVSFRDYSSIDIAIKAVETGEVAQCIVPIENSLEGSVNVTLDILAHEASLYIIREVIWPVRHNLLVKKKGEEIKVIVSHPQALAQCRRNLRRLYPDVQLRAMNSTADAAALVAGGIRNYAAVGSLGAAALYNLQNIAADIQDSSTNCTRFIVLGDLPADSSLQQYKYKTSVVCKMNGERPGSLCEVLQEFAKRNVNLTRIESRPARTGLGNYIFFFDLDGSLEQGNVHSAVEAVKEKSLWFKSFGSYPVCAL